MKIGILIKPVPDTEARIKTAADGRGIDTTDVKFVPNPYDEYAYEEGLKLNEALGSGEVVAVTVAGDNGRDVMRNALAVGCHRAIQIKVADAARTDAVQTAALLADTVKAEGFDIVFAGRQAIDMDQAQVPFHLAARLGWPVVPGILAFRLAEDRRSVEVERMSDQGRETIEVALPAIFTASKGLNDPRYAKLKGIMAAKKKPLDEKDGSTAPAATLELLKMSPPPPRPAPRIIAGEFPGNVRQLVEILRNEAKVI